MNRIFIYLLGCLFLLGFVRLEKKDLLIQNIPNNWPKPIYDFDSLPISLEGFELGRKLFHDPGLSRDSSISCASCHSQFNAFTHVDHAVSHGIDDRIGKRNSPVLINLAWMPSFHWDGGVLNLQMQPLNPITNKDEMDNSILNVLHYLNNHPEYPREFQKLFGDSIIETADLSRAIEYYTVSLISSNSRYDQFIRGETAFTKQETKGLRLFRKNCTSCHPEPLFTTNGFANNGLSHSDLDLGRYEITNQESDRYQFKIPTLRNISYSFPYMHDGSIRRLKDVLDHYTMGIDLNDPFLSVPLKKPIRLTSNDKKDLIAFLNTLTDSEFLFNKEFSP